MTMTTILRLMKILLDVVMIIMTLMLMFCAFCFQLRPKGRGWMFRMASPEDLMVQLFSLQRRRTNPDSSRQMSRAGYELFQFDYTFDGGSDSSDAGDDTSSEDISIQ